MHRLRLLSIAGLFYFAEGLPYGVVNELAPLYLRANGGSLRSVGLLSTVALAWTLKFLWAPTVDRVGRYRAWATAALMVMSCAFGALAIAPADGALFWGAIAVVALASATQDIAIDGATIVLTPERDVGPVNSVRVTFYRLALIATGGGLAVVGTRYGWPAAFVVLGIATIAIALLMQSVPMPSSERGGEKVRVIASIRRWAARSDFGPLLAVVLLFRLGDAAITPMLKPYWLDSGFSPAEVGNVTATFGIAFTIAGAIIGGLVVARIGLLRSLLILGFFQLASNVVYGVISAGAPGRTLFWGATAFENFTGGLGTAAFLALLMASCEKTNAATEYALLSAIYGLSRSIAGGSSGFLAERFGYTTFFWLTVALSVPGLMALWPLTRRRESA